MKTELVLFFEAIKDDPRISTTHISVYAALCTYCEINNRLLPLRVFSKDLLPFCKISGSSTYYRTLHELAEYGYIKYQASHNHSKGSIIDLPALHQKSS